MAVRQSLLAILDRGPCYGYQLRAEFERRTGGTWALNVGQIYNTLDRLERDGFAAKGDQDEHGHVYWEITDAGRAEVRRWLRSPVQRPAAARDELAVKLAVAATLPGVDARGLVAAEREASAARLEALTRSAADPEASSAQGMARALVLDALVCAAEAELRWLDRTADRLAQHPADSLALELSDERPKRGRPVRAAATAA
ncbi:PadR family transcriptional regulator [Microbacterium sp. NPDC019599]|uniref:PadR family transcriptional regulator n=1 Tax=Microbacterium sp. NPDC019599 TaxID=3154690 RepID=UPI0033EB2424